MASQAEIFGRLQDLRVSQGAIYAKDRWVCTELPQPKPAKKD